MPLEAYVIRLVQLLTTPFRHLSAVWLGILPIYTTLFIGELYKSKVTFAHAVGNGFVMLWAGLNWVHHLANVSKLSYLFDARVLGWAVTAGCIALGVFTIVLGLRKKDKALAEILGHTRFSCYFIILFYPMQTGLLRWEWMSVSAILIFALPAWFLIYLCGRLIASVIR